MIKACISDFGGVLTTPLHVSFQIWAEETGISLEDVGKAMVAAGEELGDNPLFMLERGELTEADFFARIDAELGEGRTASGINESYFEHIGRNQPLIEAMRGMRHNGLLMALLTNNVREWEARWRSLLPEIDEIFHTIVDSAFVGMRKPDPRIYQLTVERLGDGVRPSNCLFVDDIAENCEAARALGMTVVRFESNDQALADIEAALAE